MAILERKTEIPADRGKEAIFIRYDGQIGVGESKLAHDQLALKHELYYPDSRGRGALQVDDGGVIKDDGEKLIITEYFTTTTMPKAIPEGLKEKRDLWDIRKEIRQETGALIAKITGRKVEVHHSDETVDIF